MDNVNQTITADDLFAMNGFTLFHFPSYSWSCVVKSEDAPNPNPSLNSRPDVNCLDQLIVTLFN
jgi:hypothetical protein